MTKVLLTSQNEYMQEIIKVIRDSLLSNEFETVCVKLEPTIFKIFGINKARSIYYELKINKDYFDEYPKISFPIKISVFAKDLRRLLLSDKSFEQRLEVKNIEFFIEPPILNLTVTGTQTTLNETIKEVRDGIREEPPYFSSNIEDIPYCKIVSPKDLRVIFDHFNRVLSEEDITSIVVTLKKGMIEFALRTETKPTDIVFGQTTGKAKTSITSHSFKVIARISDKAKEAWFYVVNMRDLIVKYNFDFGTLIYLVSKTTMPS